MSATAATATTQKKLDLVIVMDATSSMSPYIAEAKRSVQSIILRITRSEKTAVRFALVAYRDHPPQDQSFITQVSPFTTQLGKMQKAVDKLSAEGGGDSPEAVTAALAEVQQLSFREDAAKVVVLIADAPPHGLGEYGDGFPSGDPLGRDPLQIARALASRGVVIYTVGCEPALSAYRSARAFFIALAQLTGGQAIGLSSSALLADVILGGSLEEVGLQALSGQFRHEMDRLVQHYRTSGRDVSSPEVTEELTTTLHHRMTAQGCQVSSMTTDGRMTDPQTAIFTQAPNLKAAVQEVMKQFGAIPPPGLPYFPYMPSSSATTSPYGLSSCGSVASPSATRCTVTTSPVSVEQCSRLVQRSVSML